MTLTEITIASLVFMVALGVLTGALISVQTVLTRHTYRSMNNDEVRLAMERLDREVRSGSLLYNPDTEPLAAYSLRILAPSATEQRCLQWRIDDDDRLVRRSWTASNGNPVDPNTVSGWSVVATGLANRSEGAPAFQLVDPTTTSGAPTVGRTVRVVFLVDQRPGTRSTQIVRVEQSLYGRNTRTGSSVDERACTPVPPT